MTRTQAVRMALNSGERRDELQVDDVARGQQWWAETVDGETSSSSGGRDDAGHTQTEAMNNR